MHIAHADDTLAATANPHVRTRATIRSTTNCQTKSSKLFAGNFPSQVYYGISKSKFKKIGFFLGKP